MKKFNPFYIDPSEDSLLDDKDLLIINSFDLRCGQSLTMHIASFDLHRDETLNLMSYLWLTLNCFGNEESSQIVRDEQRALENQKRQGFSDINPDNWVHVVRKK